VRRYPRNISRVRIAICNSRGEGGVISETSLASVEGWTDELVAKMSAAWITTAEQVVGIASTEEGLRSIAEQLQTDPATAARLVDAARAKLPEATRRALDRPADTSEFGRGALPPER
jgi:hypothetical protein